MWVGCSLNFWWSEEESYKWGETPDRGHLKPIHLVSSCWLWFWHGWIMNAFSLTIVYHIQFISWHSIPKQPGIISCFFVWHLLQKWSSHSLHISPSWWGHTLKPFGQIYSSFERGKSISDSKEFTFLVNEIFWSSSPTNQQNNTKIKGLINI